MSHDDPRVLDVAGAILDGSPVEWETLAPVGDDPISVESMRLLAAVAAAHRESSNGERGEWGSLELLDRIGSGAFGTVYRARDPALDRDVALKMLDGHPGVAAVEEGRLLARVHHPNVVTVYGAAEHDGRYGIWMEFVRGRTLAAIVAEDGPLGVNEVVSIGIDVCSALAAVHDSGLIHGDVKAQNVMREDSSGRIVLMDFGTGRLTDDSTRARLAGTPLYLAPEVLAGATPDVRADIYSAGVLLYYLLTAAFPFDGRDLDAVRSAHRAGTRVGLRERRRDVRLAVSRVIERATAADPAARFESVAAFEHALGAAGPPRRRVQVSIGLVLAGLVLLAGFVGRREVPSPAADNGRPREFVLVGAFENRTGSPPLDGIVEGAVNRELTDSQLVAPVPQGRIDDALRLMRKPLDTLLSPDVAREISLRDGATQAVVTGRIDKSGGQYQLTASVVDPRDGRSIKTEEEHAQSDAALPAAIDRLSKTIRSDFRESDSAVREKADALEKVTTPSMRALRLFTDGLRAFNGGSYPAAENNFKAAVRIDPTFASAHIWLAWTLRNLGRPADEFLGPAQRAMDLAGSTSEHEREWITGSYDSMTGRNDQAIAAYEALLRRYPDDYWALNNLAQFEALHREPGSGRIALLTMLADASPQNFQFQAQVAIEFLQDLGPEAARPRVARARQLMPAPDDNAKALISQEKISILLFPAFEFWTEGRAAEAARILDEVSDRPEFAVEHKWTLTLLGDMRMALGQIRLAEDVFSRIAPPQQRQLMLASLALARGDTAGIVERLEQTPGPTDLAASSFFVRAGDLDAAARFLRTVTVDSIDARWAKEEIDEAHGDRARVDQALAGGVPWTRAMPAGVRGCLYSETLARAAATIGERAAAIKVLEDTAVIGSRAYAIAGTSGFYWMRNQKLLADLYREDGQVDKARAIEHGLLTRLAVADQDYPLLVALKQRIGQ